MKEYSLEDLKRLLEGQRMFFAGGLTRGLDFRREQLQKLQAAIREREQEITAALGQDLGKSEVEAYATEVGFVLNSLAAALKDLKYWVADRKVGTPYYLQPAKSRIIREPYGNALIMSPFNYPFQLLMEPLVGAIAAGNTCILKPSDQAPATAEVVERLIGDTFSDIYIAVAGGGEETCRRLLELPFDYIFFTGSKAVGKLVAKAAAENLTPFTLELGGKSPVIVDVAANLKATARSIIWGKTLNMGQTCVAPDYVIADERIVDELLAELERAIVDFYSETPAESPDLGNIINERHFDRLEKMLDADSEYIFCGGGRSRDRLYIEPTVLRVPNLTAATMQEEIFGPLLPVLTAGDFNQIKSIINKNPKPLAMYIFSENRHFQQYFLDEISAGGVCVNDTIWHLANPQLPFGGVGASGIGAYHGEQSFLTFSHEKSVLERSSKFSIPLLYPPYKESALRLIKKIFK